MLKNRVIRRMFGPERKEMMAVRNIVFWLVLFALSSPPSSSSSSSEVKENGIDKHMTCMGEK